MAVIEASYIKQRKISCRRDVQNDLADVFSVSMCRHPVVGRNMHHEQNWRDKLSWLEGIVTLKSRQTLTSGDGPELRERPCTRKTEETG